MRVCTHIPRSEMDDKDIEIEICWYSRDRRAGKFEARVNREVAKLSPPPELNAGIVGLYLIAAHYRVYG